ncbi:hypothetical protein [Flavobacterium psychrophilum]|uniref:hypothetical protein n=2 Tax=Flavobacterium psychrophilum TaxID=96345 RepID=UPI000B7C2B6E|nr:hypothetical protein [Flavobacterium psychrophilum]EKT3956081.1 hypothetical protein [Flavobacterium psychrophilum]EKT4500277.1 hypothetical protein [Flavobacterium psychrophilum]EKT4549383.1 hypothetical protein [Flavobacterium psychrophilum]ELY1978039.1 hypothetical protein [Flavobacterium psychrophilum]MCB6061313.1 hypothetical protein [Flavobacterium psychrophilum]
MNFDLLTRIENSTAHRKSREDNAHYILDNPELFLDLLELAFNINNKNHYKSCWVLELVLEKQLHLLTPHLDIFCSTISNFKNESAIRPISKICMFLAKHMILTEEQEGKIVTNCFDWLILDNGKVATKAYSIRALYEFGRKNNWIYPELKQILAKDYLKHSAAYKAVTREILKKIK